MAMRMRAMVGAAGLGVSAVVHAASCDLGRVPSGFGKSPVFSGGSFAAEAVKNYTLNQPFTVKVGEPVIRTRIGSRSYTFPQEVLYKADWFLAPKYRLEAGRSYVAQQESSTQLWAIVFSDSTGAAYLFLDKDGHLCDRVGSWYRSNNNWVLLHGNYSAQPDVAATAADVVDPANTKGTVVLLDSLDAVSIGLSIRHMENGVYQDSVKQSFDNLAGLISIQGYRIKINSVGNGEASFTVVGEP